MAEGSTIIAMNSPSTKGAWRLSGTTILALALAVQLYFLLHDLSWLPRDGSPPPVRDVPMAELVTRLRDVRVQGAGDLVWESAQGGQTLYRRQSVLTLDASKAEIAFFDGTGIILDENSLIQIEKAPLNEEGFRKIVIRLLRGSIHKREPRKTSSLLRAAAPSTPELEIQVGNAQVSVPPNAEFSATADSAENRIQVHAGELTIHSSAGALELRREEEAIVPSRDSQSAPLSRKTALTPISPRAGESVSLENSGNSVKFRWNADTRVTAGQPLELESSPDPSFRESVKRVRIAPTEPPLSTIEISLRIEANVGTTPRAWYWRVRTLDGETVSRSERFWVSPRPVPQLRLPADSATLTAGRETEFFWSEVESAVGYELELSMGGKTSTVSPREAYARFILTETDSGTWRVRAKLADGKFSSWSPARAMRIRQKTPEKPTEEALPPPPSELHEPEIQIEPAPKQTWLDRLLSPILTSAFAAEPSVKYPVKLRWDPVQGVARYKVQVARTRKFEKILGESETASAEWTWNYELGVENSKGRVFFRVASMTSAGKVGAFSKPKAVQIPSSILARARKDAGAQPTLAKIPSSEVYSATEGEPETGSPAPADAEPAGNLHSLIAEKPMPARPAASMEVKPVPSTGGAGPAAGPIAVSTTESLPATTWTGSAALFTGIGGQKQTGSDASLSSVETESAHLQQKVRLESDLLRNENHWTGVVQVGFAGFHKPDTTRTIVQPDVKGYTFDFEAFRWAKNSEQQPWQVAWGGILDRSYRWSKTGPQSVEPDGSLSLGPAVRVMRRWNGGHFGARVALPLTGAATQGHFGADGSIWGEWKLTRIDITSLGLIAETEARYLRWTGASGAGRFSWVASLALSLQIDFTRPPSP